MFFFFKSLYFDLLGDKHVIFFQNTLSQYPCSIHPGEFPGENLFCKITPRRKTFGFITSLAILYNLLHPVENTKSWIIPNEFMNFTPMNFDVTGVISNQSLVCGSVSSGSRQSEVTFHPGYQVKFPGYDRLVCICFNDILW